jgi:hypothetical protein
MAHFALTDQQQPVGRSAIDEDARLQSTAHPPVFLHCGWRTRGTWLWNQFRGMRGVTGYYEPLNEHLARILPSTLDSINAESWASGHEGLDRPYFDEFRPLLRPGRPGVPRYQSRFATTGFFAAPESALPELDRYLRGLIDAARERGEQPVLKFCRSIGRIGWMRRHFPDAVHVVVLRDPFSQFASALRQYVRYGNAYFLTMPSRLLAANHDLPPVSAAIRHLGAEQPRVTDERACQAACEATLRAGTPASWYRGFLAFWVVTAAMIPDEVDLVIDSDALTNADAYRQRCEIDLARLTGRMVVLGDANCPWNAEAPEPPGLRRSEVLRAHAGAEAFLAEQAGTAWADRPVLGHAARKLAEARSHALGAITVPWAPRSDVPGRAAEEPDYAGALLSATARAAWAERELAAIRASRSWRVTAPLRWLRESRFLG